MFTETELKMIENALRSLHDADLSGYKKEEIEALESAMGKLNMQFVSWKMGTDNIKRGGNLSIRGYLNILCYSGCISELQKEGKISV